MARNLTDALTSSLKALLTEGYTVPSRNGETKELYSHQVRIEKPHERVIITPARGVNPFAQIAETLWVIGGRDDMEYLSRYLPRARDFSDDGQVWRGAYGPRLRAWRGGIGAGEISGGDHAVDQLEECVKILCESIDSRRAVMVIFDPAQDFCQSKDIPCNNWLHFLVRDGKLNLTVGVRSNDAIWGFSGINMFEWSVLQQFMAHWLNVEVGTMAYTASSFHLYDYHYEKAQKIVQGAKSKTLYDFGNHPVAFNTCWEDFQPSMEEFYLMEARIWENGSTPEAVVGGQMDQDIQGIADPFLRVSLQMLRVYQAYQSGATPAALAALVDRMPCCDFKMAAIDWLGRQKRLRVEAGFMSELDQFPMSPEEQNFLEWYSTPPSTDVSIAEIFDLLKTLHYKKTLSYGDSWKKHGEVLGLFSNITRKRDRILSLLAGAQGTTDEGIFDTISDLCVYAGKYLTLIAELYPVEFGDFLKDANAQVIWPTDIDEYSHTLGFDPVLDMLQERSGGTDPRVGKIDWESLEDCIAWIEDEYKKVEDLLTDKYQPRSGNRNGHGKIATQAAARMCLLSAQALRVLCRDNPGTWEAYQSTVEGL